MVLLSIPISLCLDSAGDAGSWGSRCGPHTPKCVPPVLPAPGDGGNFPQAGQAWGTEEEPFVSGVRNVFKRQNCHLGRAPVCAIDGRDY